MKKMPEIATERIKEMYRKFAELAGAGKPLELGKHLGGVECKLEVSVPEALISLGIAKDEDEGMVFLACLIAGSRAAAEMWNMSPSQSAQDLIKAGFLLGLAAGKPKMEGVN